MCYYYNYDRNVTMLAKPITGGKQVYIEKKNIPMIALQI